MTDYEKAIDALGKLASWVRTVRMDGERFELTPTQAGIVRALHKAYEGGNPERPQEYVLEEAGSSASRMSGLFKRNRAAWKARHSRARAFK